MPVELILTPDAEADVGDAYIWYEERRTGLGEEFMGCVDACLHSLQRTPEKHPKAYGSYRRALVRRFPYTVYYELKGNVVTVSAVVHNARDPQKWRTRLEQP